MRTDVSWLFCALLVLTFTACDTSGGSPPDDPTGVWRGSVSTSVDTSVTLDFVGPFDVKYSIKGEAERRYTITVSGEPGDYEAEIGITHTGWFVNGPFDTTHTGFSASKVKQARYAKPVLVVDELDADFFSASTLRFNLKNTPSEKVGFTLDWICEDDPPCAGLAFSVLLGRQGKEPLALSR